MARPASTILLTTTSTVEERPIAAYLGIVAAHVVAGTGLFSDWAASFSDVFGGRSSSYARQLEAINAEALDQLRQRGAALGADAIVGVSIDHDEVSGGGKSMFMVTVSGTAVRLSKTQDRVGESVLEGAFVEDRAWLVHLLETMEQGTVPSDDQMQRVVASGDPSFAPSLLRLAALPAERRPARLFSTPSQQGILHAYFDRMRLADAQQALYDALLRSDMTDDGLAKLSELIKDLRATSLRHAHRIIRSGNVRARVQALRTLSHAQRTYDASDVAWLDRLLADVVDAFPDVSQDVEKRGLIGAKSVWVCGYCGEENGASSGTCERCQRDRRGILYRDRSPERVVEGLRLYRTALLKELEGAWAADPAEEQA